VSELERLVSSTRERVAAQRRRRPFSDALRSPGVSLIAEHKRSSPSAGVIRDDLEPQDVVGAYERGGASALSILTEPTRFGGALEDLRAARTASALPILRKDFIVERYQVYESAVAGADAILLIVAAISPAELGDLHALAGELGLAALVEVHDERELDAALQAGAELIGINNRNLATLEVDLATTLQLRPRVPEGVTVVAESGFGRREEIARLEQAGVDAVLIGEALMRAPDIEAAVRTMYSWSTTSPGSSSAASRGSTTPGLPSTSAPGRSG
jgi:indole-3-glycerol phosphate synthase